MNYRRAYVPGASYFFTLVTRNRAPCLADPALVNRLKRAFRHVKAAHPFRLEALVVLPDHLHAIWTQPDDDADFSTRWRLIKHFVQRGAERPVWQARFWEHLIRDERDYERHFDYIHANPVKHGVAAAPGDWPHSTFHRCVRQGIYPADWCALDQELELELE